VTAINAFSGIGFAGANLVLAWALPAAQYGLVALIFAFTNIGVGLGPLGLNGVVNRQLVRADRRLLGYGFSAAVLTALTMTSIVYAEYSFSLPLLFLMFTAIVAGALTLLASAQFQVRQRFALATSLGQFGNLGLAITSVIVLIYRTESPLLPLSLIAIAFAISAYASWSALLHENNESSRQIQWHDWSDAISMAGLTAAALVLLQLERILIPQLMSFEALATYGVMAALVIAPYRSLELAITSTMLPRLRVIDDRVARRHLIEMEILLVCALCLVGGFIVWFVAPPIIDWLYGDRYPVTSSLVLAGIIGGTIKVGSSICRGAATAYCSTRELWALAWLSWAAVGIGAVGAYFGARWGLPGIVYGAASGFIFRAIASSWVAAKYFLLIGHDQAAGG
jgi:O-antigen/teichoic acid export membrane protein